MKKKEPVIELADLVSEEESKPDPLKIEWWPIDKPIEYARNPRTIPEKAIDKVAASLKQFGWRQPIVVDPEGVIVVGHTRLRAAKKLGFGIVPVHVAHDLTIHQIQAYRLADNRTAEETEWDDAFLKIELSELAESFSNLDLITGFEIAEIERLTLGTEAPQDPAANWDGMPDFGQADLMPKDTLLIHFTGNGRAELARLINQPLTEKTKFICFPAQDRAVVKDKRFKSDVAEIVNIYSEDEDEEEYSEYDKG